jgi:hypothetical protein
MVWESSAQARLTYMHHTNRELLLPSASPRSERQCLIDIANDHHLKQLIEIRTSFCSSTESLLDLVTCIISKLVEAYLINV